MNRKIILDAIQDNKIVRIRYADRNGNISVRNTEPYEIKGDKYYGYCLEKNGIRSFTMQSIMSASMTGETFTPRF